jgi:hypothetical protein
MNLKKIFFGATLMLAGAFSMQAQTDDIVRTKGEGDFYINPFYGSSSIPTMLMKGAFSDVENFTVIGPAGINIEYMFSDIIALGVEVSYSLVSMDYTDDQDFAANIKLQNIRVYPRLTFHINELETEKVIPYAVIGTGFKSTRREFSTDNSIEEVPDVFEASLPFALRLAMGSRFYLTDNFGFSLELGIGGGSLLNTGLVFKM